MPPKKKLYLHKINNSDSDISQKERSYIMLSASITLHTEIYIKVAVGTWPKILSVEPLDTPNKK